MSALFFLLGLATRSFLNLYIDRLPKRESIVRPRLTAMFANTNFVR
ncbi:MAG: hypothetical protein QMC90_04915 [Dehalococcoidales bacterium]|nr:hypothetical protein [Dehalococcoidales bacterium]